MSKNYTVVNIIRLYDSTLSFIICLCSDIKEYYKVHNSLSERISRGMVFIGDCIKITSFTDEGIIFEISPIEEANKTNTETDVEFFYSDTPKAIKPVDVKHRFLPFLCDILPYNCKAVPAVAAIPIFKNKIFTGKYSVGDIEVSNVKHPLPSNFIAKIHQKTRINTYPTMYNPFFFIIVSSNNIFLKIVFWAESLRDYSSLRVGDIVMIKDFKQKKKWASVDKIDPNTFTESLYFNVDEITAKEVIKVKYDKKTKDNFVFESVSGEVEYLSILMRCNYNGSLMEYVLLKVNGKKVVLFYNSDPEFYNIEVRSKIHISELRKIHRAGIELFVSTIYTQFTFCKNTEKSEQQEQSVKRIKRNESINDNIEAKVETDGLNEDTEKVLSGEKAEIHQNPEEVSLFDAEAKDNQSSSDQLTSHAENRKYIFAAMGFIPDNFWSISAILDHSSKETINGTEIVVNLFMKPVFCSISDLAKINLVLNESKKFIVNAKITRIVDVECIVDYIENGENKKQGSFAVVLDNAVEVFVYDNFFNDPEEDYPALSFKTDADDLVNKEKNFVIEAFRADESNILYYLTGIIEN